ncbi:hypothetical protein AAVH_17615 [Aphelenchoides avenae]|nr:hypothetical protein AAVH_17615 [Aphelenchus avenae]
MEQAKASDENPVTEELPHEHGSPTSAARDGTTTSTHIGETSPATSRPNDGNQTGKEETPHEGDPPEPAAQVGTTTPAQFAEASLATGDNQAAKDELHHEDHASTLAATEAATASTHRTASSSSTGGANNANPANPEKVLHKEDAAKTADQTAEATTPSTDITETSLTTGGPTEEDPPAPLAAQPQMRQSQQTQTDGDGDIAVTATEVGNIPGADAPKSWWQRMNDRQKKADMFKRLKMPVKKEYYHRVIQDLQKFIKTNENQGRRAANAPLEEFSCRSFRFNVGCVGLLLLIVGNAGWFIAVNLIELIGPHATKPFL